MCWQGANWNGKRRTWLGFWAVDFGRFLKRFETHCKSVSGARFSNSQSRNSRHFVAQRSRAFDSKHLWPPVHEFLFLHFGRRTPPIVLSFATRTLFVFHTLSLGLSFSFSLSDRFCDPSILPSPINYFAMKLFYWVAPHTAPELQPTTVSQTSLQPPIFLFFASK